MSKIAIIPAAGRGTRMLSLTDNNPKAMLPLQNKPIIGHQLDWLIENGYDEVVVVVGYKHEKIIKYVRQMYRGKNIKIKFALQEKLNGLAPAILKGIEQVSDIKQPIMVCLGDIVPVAPIDFENEEDYSIILYNKVTDYKRWCMIKTESEYDVSKINRFYDKPEKKVDTDKNIIGIYFFQDCELLKECIQSILKSDKKIKGEYQLSQALELYRKKDPILAKFYDEYYDLGEIEALNKTRKNIARHFNSIELIDGGTIRKTSENSKKLLKEVSWYQEIPQKLKKYTPNIYGFAYAKEDENKFHYDMEYVNSTPLQELFLYDLPADYEWKNIFSSISDYLKETIIPISEQQLSSISLARSNYEMLIDKTNKRIDMLDDKYFEPGYYAINDMMYKNPLKHMDVIFARLQNIFTYPNVVSRYFSYLHGDLFFGNMMYDIPTGDLKVIDPRGEYGSFTTKGDIRYDFAKLNHSINGYYDFIVNGLYTLDEFDDFIFQYSIYDSTQVNAQIEFDKLMKEFGINKREINLLTGILFLTMIPLHSENEKNQKMQFIKAVEFLNEFI